MDHRIIVFQIGDGYFGTEIHNVKEIVQNADMKKCLNPFSDIVGILNLNRSIIPVVDLHKKFHMGSLPTVGNIFFVVFILEEKMIAVPVDSVEQYYDVPQESMLLLPSILRTENRQYIQQVIRLYVNLYITSVEQNRCAMACQGYA